VVVGNFDGITADVVLERLLSSDHENIRYVLPTAGVNSSAEAKNPIRCIMGRMITGNVDGTIEYIHAIAGQDMAQNRLAFLLRLSVHILLAMRDLEIPHTEQAANEIIREYVDALMEYHAVVPFTSKTNSRMTISLCTHITYPIDLELRHTQYS